MLGDDCKSWIGQSRPRKMVDDAAVGLQFLLQMVPRCDGGDGLTWIGGGGKWMAEGSINLSIYLYPRLSYPVLANWWMLPPLVSISIAHGAVLRLGG